MELQCLNDDWQIEAGLNTEQKAVCIRHLGAATRMSGGPCLIITEYFDACTSMCKLKDVTKPRTSAVVYNEDGIRDKDLTRHSGTLQKRCGPTIPVPPTVLPPAAPAQGGTCYVPESSASSSSSRNKLP